MSSRNIFFEYSLPENPLPNRFQNYRLNNKYIDVKIKVGDKLFPAHKMVLEDSSPVLKVLLSKRWLRDNVCEFEEKFVSAEIVEDLLNYFYLAKIVLTPENAHALCIASHYLQILNLVSISEKFLSKQITSENVFELFLFANRLELKLLPKCCVKFIHETRNDKLWKDEKLKSFSFENLNALLAGMNEMKHSEKLERAKFESLLAWIEFNPSKQSSLSGLMKHIRFEGFSEAYLKSVIDTSNPNSKLLSEFIAGTFHDQDESELQEKFPTDYTLKTSQNFEQRLFHLKINETVTRDERFGDMCKHAISVSKFSPHSIEMQEMFSDREFKPLLGETVTIIDDKIYCFRARINSNHEPVHFMEMFDCSLSLWQKFSELPEETANWARCSRDTRSIALKDSIFITNDTDGKNNTLFKYNIKDDKWTRMKSMLTNRKCYVLAELNDRLYAIGGFFVYSHIVPTTSVEQYDPETDQWRFVTSLNYYHDNYPRADSDAMSFAGQIYIIGSNGFETYTPEIDRWKPLKTLNNYKKNTLVVFDNKLCAVGKNSSDNWAFFEFDIFLEEWLEMPNVDNGRLREVFDFDNPNLDQGGWINPSGYFISSSGQQSFSVIVNMY